MTEVLGQGRVGLLNERRTHPALLLFILPSSHSFLRAQGLLPHWITARLRLVHQHRDAFCLWSQSSLSKGVNKQDPALGQYLLLVRSWLCLLDCLFSSFSKIWGWVSTQITVHFQNVTKMWENRSTHDQIASKQMQLSGKDLRDVSVGPWEFQSLHSYTAMKTKW